MSGSTSSGAGAQPKVGTPAKLTGEAELVSQLGQQDDTGVADDALAIASDFEPGPRVGSLHLRGLRAQRYLVRALSRHKCSERRPEGEARNLAHLDGYVIVLSLAFRKERVD